MLSWVVLVNHGEDSSPAAVGFSTVALQLFAFPFTGACFNPTHALMCLLCSGSITDGMLVLNTAPHILGPALGVVFAQQVRNRTSGGEERDLETETRARAREREREREREMQTDGQTIDRRSIDRQLDR